MAKHRKHPSDGEQDVLSSLTSLRYK